MQREKTSINRSWLDWGAASKDEALNQIISIPSNLNFNTNPIPQFEFRDLNKQIKIKLYVISSSALKGWKVGITFNSALGIYLQIVFILQTVVLQNH